MRRLMLVLFCAGALQLFAQPASRTNAPGLTRSLADTLYCQLTGCTMTGKLRLINGTAAAPSADSAAGAGFHLTATAFAIDAGGTTTTICGVGCAAGSGGTYGWSSTADATATADLKLVRVGAKQLGWQGATAGAITHDFSGLTATRITTWPDVAGTVFYLNGGQTVTSATWNGTAVGLQYGGTGANLSATGGSNQVLQQTSSGAAITVGTLASTNLSDTTNIARLNVANNFVATSIALNAATAAVNLDVRSTATNSGYIIGTSNSDTTHYFGAYSGAAGTNPAIYFNANDRLQIATTTNYNTTGLTEKIGVDTNGLILTSSQVTAGTMTMNVNTVVRLGVVKASWTNAMVAALGATTAGDILVCTLPAKTVVKNAYVLIGTAAGTVTTLTVAVGRTSATYIDYIVASDAKAAANTVYGDASGERGTNLTGYDLPSWTGTTAVNAHFISTGGNLSTVTTSTGTVYLEVEVLP